MAKKQTKRPTPEPKATCRPAPGPHPVLLKLKRAVKAIKLKYLECLQTKNGLPVGTPRRDYWYGQETGLQAAMEEMERAGINVGGNGL